MDPNVSYLIRTADSGLGFVGRNYDYNCASTFFMICAATGDSQFVVTGMAGPRYNCGLTDSKYRETLFHARRVAYRGNQMRFFQDDSTKRIAFRRLW
jgi:hypothetical protein